MSAAYRRGDIVRMDLLPHHEGAATSQLALVLIPNSPRNQALSVVVPIIQGEDIARHAGFSVRLDGDSVTKGYVIANKYRNVNLTTRRAKIVEEAPVWVIDDVMARLQAMFK